MIVITRAREVKVFILFSPCTLRGSVLAYSTQNKNSILIDRGSFVVKKLILRNIFAVNDLDDASQLQLSSHIWDSTIPIRYLSGYYFL